MGEKIQLGSQVAVGICEVQDYERKFAFVLCEMSIFKIERKTWNSTDHEMKNSNAVSGQNYALDAAQSGDCSAVLSPTAGHLFWPQAFLAFFSQQRCFDLCQWFSDQAKEASKCVPMVAGEHYNAIYISLFRKSWEDWKSSSGGPKISRVCSQQVSMGLCSVLAREEKWAERGPAGLQSSHLLTVVCSCVYSMFLGKLARQRASYIHVLIAFNSSTAGMKAIKQDLN